MAQQTFLHEVAWSTLADIAALTGAQLLDAGRAGQRVNRLASLDSAGPTHLAFFDNRKYLQQLAATRAGACLVSERLEAEVPPHVAILRIADPYRAFVGIAREWHANALRPGSSFDTIGIAASAVIHPTALLEDGVIVDPHAVIGPHVEIGAGTVIGANAVIGERVKIGRACSVGIGSSILCALIGNDVIIHPGCRIGQDGYGFLSGRTGHVKIPQIGRVIIQNSVEIGAGTTIDRGALRDTVIGEGTKIDNLVQVGHNVVIGRNCIVVSQSGIAGSAVLGDGVVLGARVGVSDHATIGEGSQIAARSSVVGEVPPGSRWGGSPAKPIKQFFREIFALERLGREGSSNKRNATDTSDEGRV
jgi:UDP-3-O-[3-hydroxymyristoyl] glucosamine N-acyltransferase